MITSAKKLINPYTNEYSALEVVKDGITMSVPINLANTDYAEVMEQVEAGELTIEEAE
tara:strand:- start:1114 stop:1287 length:174 start_codon:yes stop_codon:yes gene_type:complete